MAVMTRRDLLLTGTAAVVSGCATAPQEIETVTAAPPKPTPPAARKDAKSITQLGRTRTDEYAWMKDDRWQEVLKDPTVLRADVRDHLVAENAYTTALMAGTEALQEKLFQEMKARIKEDDSTVPAGDGPWDYYSRYAPGAQHPIYARRPRGKDVGEEILIDVDAQAKGKAFYKVGAAVHAPDHKLFAYAEDDQGSEVWSVKVKDLATGGELPEPIENCYGGFAWSPDAKHIFWVYRDDNGRPAKVYRRPARGGAKDDVLVYEEPDEGFFLDVGVTEDNSHILIGAGNGETSEYRVIPARTPTAKPALFEPRKTGVLYQPTVWDGQWRILTNVDGAVDFQIMTAPLARTERKNWKPWIAHQPGRYIEGVVAFKEHLVRLERFNALPRLVVRARNDGAEHEIAQAEEAYDLSFVPGFEHDTGVMRFAYESPSTPRQWFDYDMTTRAKTLRKTQEVPSGHDAARYVVKRFTAKAKDGAEIPVTLLALKSTPLDGSAPVLLYGYGSYGISIEANFSTRNLSLVDRGWVWATAHVRGGAEKGRQWFEDGRKDKKMNSFTDFVAVADHMIAGNMARPRRIVAVGRSAGGLLMGAVANLAPDRFAGIVAGVPFVDALNTMSDVSLPLTPPEWPEWGNPLTDEKAYDTIAAYSPYDNVADRPYPAILATGGLSDPRVTYWEPAKWIARLRDRAPKAGPYLLKMNMDAGHAGAAGRFDFLKDPAFDFAFAIKAIGAAEAGGAF
jgi:oligopeptidase B